MRSRCCPEDTAARLGGDEFAILLEDTPPQRAVEVAGLLLEALGSAFPSHLGGHRHVVEASVGVAGIEEGGPGAEDLMRDADLAMYVAKERGKGCVAVYDAALHARAVELLELRTDLAEAIREGQLVLHYQPTVDLRTQTVSGFEALVRWAHPTRGLLFPGDFIGEAERSGLVVPMGEWVLREACRAAVGMQVDGDGPSMAVNVAAAQLAQPGFAETVLDVLRTAGLPPHRLVLEITETAVVEDIETSVVLLGGLREHGVRVAIDDFGTGYNSLSSLAALPADVLKVDKSFVDRLGGAQADSSLVEAILAMSTALSLVTVAEGVEDADQARWLHQHAASTGQGYLWSRPVPLEAAVALLRDGLPQVSDIAGAPVAQAPPEPPVALHLVTAAEDPAPGSAIA